MRETVKNAIGTTVQDMLESGLKSSFTKREINALGIEITEVLMTPIEIKNIRKKTHLSQTVFAGLVECQSLLCQTMGAGETCADRCN